MARRQKVVDRWAELATFRAGLPEEERQEQFYFLRWGWDIVKARYLIAQTPHEVRGFPATEWAGRYGLDGADAAAGLIHVTDARARVVDLTIPLIVGTAAVGGHTGHLLLDGWHRCRRAVLEGIPTLPAYLLSLDETAAIEL